jgi:hypothetical protein
MNKKQKPIPETVILDRELSMAINFYQNIKVPIANRHILAWKKAKMFYDEYRARIPNSSSTALLEMKHDFALNAYFNSQEPSDRAHKSAWESTDMFFHEYYRRGKLLR